MWTILDKGKYAESSLGKGTKTVKSLGDAENKLFYGDNLDILRKHVASESVDLIYLDPPFNSNRSYNVLFKDESGKHSEAQIEAFEDTWHWSEDAEQAYYELWSTASEEVSRAVVALRGLLGDNQVTAYLMMMAIRLVELHRVLRSTGSIYLHCDPTASHYLKVLMDAIFGPTNFRNEIVWHYSGWNKHLRTHFERRSDNILFYAKSKSQIFNGWSRPWQNVEEYLKVRKQKLRKDELGRDFVYSDAGGGKRVKRYIDEAMSKGAPIDNVWNIDKLNNSSKERLGYPTQKPLSLLERIVQASSNTGDVVLDPFCGCGTTIAAAHSLGRRWLGIDITALSISLQKNRLASIGADSEFIVIGEPEDLESARHLAHDNRTKDNRYQFQWWALSLVSARPLGGKPGEKTGKKGADRGIDGVINFVDDRDYKPKRVVVQVKSGKVKSGDLRDLRGTLEREEATMGIFITLEEPTRDMKREAVSAGFYSSPGWGQDYPRLQILTIKDLLGGAGVKMPPQHGTFKEAHRALSRTGELAESSLRLEL